MKFSTEVVLATYNGEGFIEEFLQSLLDQSYADFSILVRDDLSTDRTPDILRDWQPRFEGRMRIVSDGTSTGSAKGNFARLMAETSAERILFADQDDVWTSDHVSTIVNLLRDEEEQCGRECPVFAFTDLVPVDRDLVTLADSYFRYKRIDPNSSQILSKTIVCVPMLGCAAGINRALLELAVPVPIDRVTGHDWWALLLAAAAGKVVYSENRTVHYRLHGSNSSSQMQTSVNVYLSKTGKAARVRRGLDLRREQARAVRDRLDPIRHSDAIKVLQRFEDVVTSGPISRRIGLLKGNYLYSDPLRNIATLVLC